MLGFAYSHGEVNMFDWLANPDDLLTKVLIPVFTFFAGAAVTLTLKRLELRRTIERERVVDARTAEREKLLEARSHVNEVVKNMTTWYHQLDDLNGEVVAGRSDGLAVKNYRYRQNRHVLPSLVLSLERLRQYDAAHPFVENADAFLDVVTDADPSGGRMCRDAFAGGNLSKTLGLLDSRLQSATKLAVTIEAPPNPRQSPSNVTAPATAQENKTRDKAK